MIGKKLKTALSIFFIINSIIAFIFIALALVGLFISVPTVDKVSDVGFFTFAIYALMRIKWFVAVIPFITFLLWNKIHRIIVGVVTVLWILFLIFIFSFFLISYNVATNPDITICDLKSGIERDECFKNEAVKEVIKIRDNQVFEELARVLTFCDKVNDKSIKDTCLDVYYREKADLEGSIEFCEKITNTLHRDSCLQSIITQRIKDSSLCPKISDEKLRESCIDTIRIFEGN